jgi:predicted dehydrogenase
MGQSLGQALAGIPNAKLAAVYDPLKEAAEAAAEKLGAPFDTDIAKFLSRKRLDGVIVASPPFKHKDVAATKAGKHLFLEKPLAPNVRDCDSIIRAARKAGVKLMVGQVCRYHAMHRKVRDMVVEGAIGTPVFMHVYRIGGGWGGVWAKSWRLSRKKSGGTLMEVNAHEIDFMRFVCGDVKSVYAAGGRYIHDNIDYPDLAAVTLVFKSGAVGFLHSSQVSTLGGYGGRVDGTKGTLHFPSIWGEGAGIHHKRWDSEATFIPASGLSVPNPVQTEVAEWLKAIRNNTEPPIPGEVGRAAVQVAEAAYESIETGKPVVLE